MMIITKQRQRCLDTKSKEATHRKKKDKTLVTTGNPKTTDVHKQIKPNEINILPKNLTRITCLTRVYMWINLETKCRLNFRLYRFVSLLIFFLNADRLWLFDVPLRCCFCNVLLITPYWMFAASQFIEHEARNLDARCQARRAHEA